MNEQEVLDALIVRAKTMRADAKGNEAKWYWNGVIDGLNSAKVEIAVEVTEGKGSG